MSTYLLTNLAVLDEVNGSAVSQWVPFGERAIDIIEQDIRNKCTREFLLGAKKWKISGAPMLSNWADLMEENNLSSIIGVIVDVRAVESGDRLQSFFRVKAQVEELCQRVRAIEKPFFQFLGFRIWLICDEAESDARIYYGRELKEAAANQLGVKVTEVQFMRILYEEVLVGAIDAMIDEVQIGILLSRGDIG